MDNKRRVMGKGLEELFSNEKMDFSSIEESIVNSTSKDEIVELNINELRSNPYQPRKIFDAEKLDELAESIKEHGVIQPIIVKKSSIKGYEIIAGERRVKASEIAGKKTIPSIVRDFTDDEMMEIALLENLQRENLNAIEEANAYKQLLEKLRITQEELAKRLGKSRSYITNMVGLLNLPDHVKNLINKDKISASHARILSKLETAEEVDALVEKILNENLNVRQTENIIRGEKPVKTTKKSSNSQFSHLEDSLSEKLGTRVKIRNNTLEVYFSNVNDLNRILEIMNIDE